MAGDPDDGDDVPDLPHGEEAAFRRLLEMLHAEYNFDFREYKTISLLRRIRARMAHVHVAGFDTYIDYLRAHAHEATALFNTILVNVTGFFRDAEAWQVLKTEALPALVADAMATGRMRIWSAGCSTGEEPYSAAILIAEALGERAADIDVKIYATDIDEEALVSARQGVFRTDQLRDVPADTLRRHFVPDGHLFRIRREIRRWCIFGRHNLAQDPPLPHVALLICRNLLIYFRRGLQERLLSRFHYALQPNGVLFLGRSESLVARSTGFTPINQKWRIFRRSAELGIAPDISLLRQEVAAMGDVRAQPPGAGEPPRITTTALIRALPVPVILIGVDDSVREWNEAASALYEIPAENAIGRQFRDLDISYRAEGLRARIEDVKRAVGGVRLENVVFSRRSGEMVHVDFWVSRVYDERSRPAAIMVAAWDGTVLARFREEIVRLAEQHATATEELQSTNEELQSTNEELLTTVDELQAANGELAARSSEVRQLLAYYRSILTTVTEPIVVLDQLFKVTAWNPAAERLFGIPSSAAVGRDFFSLSLPTPVPAARTALSRVGSGVAPTEGEDLEFHLPSGDGSTRRAVLRFLRLMDGDGVLQGILGLGRPGAGG